MADLIWHVIYLGSGSVTGNDWLEEVCYLGDGRWLLRIRDDPAWSLTQPQSQEAEEKLTPELVAWAAEMDSYSDIDSPAETRISSLKAIALEVGEQECSSILISNGIRPSGQ